MRTIVHLSDLHFGRVDDTLLAPLVVAIDALSPHLIAVSGDLTQRARAREFRAARAFLDRLPTPQIVVPGNHDIPLHNVISRFFGPLVKYRRYLTADLEPFFADDEIAVMGINTARSLTFKGGRVNAAQIEHAKGRLCPVDRKIVKVIVTHHPFDLANGRISSEPVGRADLAMEMLSACRCDLLLAGHLHVSDASTIAMRSVTAGHQAILVQAGTATSTRGRGEINSFNSLHVAADDIEIRRHGWRPEQNAFEATSSERFARTIEGWKIVSALVAKPPAA